MKGRKDHLAIYAEAQRAQRLVTTLAERWPRCFAVAECRRLQLKLRITTDIVNAGLDLDDVHLALRWYTHSTGYKKMLVAGAVRIGLDGEPAGIVSDEHAAHAAKQLAKREHRRIERERQRAAMLRKAMPRRLSFSDLRTAALARKQQAAE
jgi:ProP effector